MVGVPRSKGCTTCRRRKVACDQQKPHCQTCQKRGVTCEGYAQYPVILQWTSGGLKKRRRFEEVASTASSSSDSDVSDIAKKFIDSGSISTLDLLLPRQVNTGPLILKQMQVRCLDSYLPQVGSAVPDVQSSWLWSTVAMSDHGRALAYSFSALCLTRVGIVLKDESLIKQGRCQYSLALISLQQALYDPELAFQDRTLAAIRTLSIYELLVPGSAKNPAARAHEDGMAQWCLAAGPKSINTEFAMQVFTDVRWSIMIHCIERHQSSVLGSKGWKTLPWQCFNKDLLQQLFDIGFDLAELLEQVDQNDGLIGPQASTSKLAQHLTSCSGIFEELEMWHINYLTSQELGLYNFNRQNIQEAYGSFPEHHDALPEFESMWEATNSLYYWWLKLVLNGIILSLLHRVSQKDQVTSLQQIPMTADTALSAQIFSISPGSASSGCFILTQEQLTGQSLRLANDIVLTTPFFLADDKGWLGPQMLLFPLREAMQHLAKIHSPFFSDAQTAFSSLIARLLPR